LPRRSSIWIANLSSQGAKPNEARRKFSKRVWPVVRRRLPVTVKFAHEIHLRKNSGDAGTFHPEYRGAAAHLNRHYQTTWRGTAVNIKLNAKTCPQKISKPFLPALASICPRD